MSLTWPSKNKRVINIAVHILIWAALFAIPYLLNVNEIPPFWVVVKRSWLPLMFSALIFYLNYFLLVDRLLFSKKRWLFILANVGLVLLIFWLNVYVKSLFPSIYNAATMDADSLGRQARIRELARYSSVISFVLSVVFCVAIKLAGRWIRIEADREKSEKMHLEAELIHLRYQLQPHFFFNSLNNIYALIDKSPEVAKNAVHGLGKLMRYLLYETNNTQMALDTEINFLVKYIQLMELRLTKNILVEYDFPEDGAAYQVAPLLFIPLVENAFKHGIPVAGNAAIFFKMEVNERRLTFITGNVNAPKDDTDKSGTGIGLDNLRKRLELIYPGRHVFTTDMENNRYTTTLVLNFA